MRNFTPVTPEFLLPRDSAKNPEIEMGYKRIIGTIKTIGDM
jgi:hypothetical protein